MSSVKELMMDFDWIGDGETGESARVFRDHNDQTQSSWSRSRRVVSKAEFLTKGRNPRFVATTFTLKEIEASQLYEQEYCARGEAENRIKEQQLYLFGNRASATTRRANQVRLYFSGLAYLLLQAIRRLGLRGTDMASARADTIRVRLFKIAAAVRISVRKVWVRLSSHCPFAEVFAQARLNLLQSPTLVM
jgi:hypothetical protein